MVIGLPNWEGGNGPPTIRSDLEWYFWASSRCRFQNHILITQVEVEKVLDHISYHKIGEIAHSFRDNACHALDDHGRIFLDPGFFRLVPERCKKPLILQNLRPLAVYGNRITKYGSRKRTPYIASGAERGVSGRIKMCFSFMYYQLFSGVGGGGESDDVFRSSEASLHSV